MNQATVGLSCAAGSIRAMNQATVGLAGPVQLVLCSWAHHSHEPGYCRSSLCSWSHQSPGYYAGFVQVTSQEKLEQSGKIRKRFPVTRKSRNIDYSPIVREFENYWVENQTSTHNQLFFDEAEGNTSNRNNDHWVIKER